MAQSTIDIQPSPRILGVLGNIAFSEWQCIAELVDNAFDDYLEVVRAGEASSYSLVVDVTIPTAVDMNADAEVVVTDYGRGMSLATLNDSVRAGWTSNDGFNKLGLFGIGFNIATARLGSVATILTSRAGDKEKVGVEIDLVALAESAEFRAPVVRVPKDDPSEHGTEIRVSRLKPEHSDWLRRNASRLAAKLGDVYSYLLDEQGFELRINGDSVQPHRPCHWDKSRSIEYGSGKNSERIPAVIEIDKELAPLLACENCRRWQSVANAECEECGSDQLVKRDRRIHGWLGIQRYLHQTDYGIDFLRNGRKILVRDKSYFAWVNPNDPLATEEIEYPVELGGQGGRIIGEIHLDYVPVNYMKDSFEEKDKGWIGAREFLRGAGPLRPKIASQAGFGENTSPLGDLFRGFRRNDPGLRHLVPGNGSGPIHEETRKWGEHFQAGEPEYQSDEKWYEAAVFHDQLTGKKSSKTPTNQKPTATSAISRLGLDTSEGEGSNRQTAPTKKSETESERIAKYRPNSAVAPELTGTFSLEDIDARMKVKTYVVSGEVVCDGDGRRVPVLASKEPGNVVALFVDSKHSVFNDFTFDIHEAVISEIARQLLVRADSGMPISDAVAHLLNRYLPDRRLNQSEIAGQCVDLLGEIKDRYAAALDGNFNDAFEILTQFEIAQVEERLASHGSGKELDHSKEDGSFITFAPATFLVNCLRARPELLMDGQVFSPPFSRVESDRARSSAVEKVAMYLTTVGSFGEGVADPTREELQHAQLSLGLLRVLVAESDG